MHALHDVLGDDVHPFAFHSLQYTLTESKMRDTATFAGRARCMSHLNARISVRVQGAQRLRELVTAHSHQVERPTLRRELSWQHHLRGKGLHSTVMSEQAAEKGGAATAKQAPATRPGEKEHNEPAVAFPGEKRQPLGPAHAEQDRVQAIKDGMFRTHGWQEELAAQMADRVITSGARFCLIGDVSIWQRP